ncbi:MAG: SufE family protein [Bacteroidia bacterium]|uniref:SufE family protein n=1 Tax=Candidatus Pollutiaquabacter sp. TaxID=3416354 RepID=UPI0039623674|nr:SufE family protein [Bacteroidota bacterium]
MATIQELENAIVEDFALFDDWTEKYQYIIELGQQLPEMADALKTEDRKIKGCQSSVWLSASMQDGKVWFEADSDSTFVKGEIALLLRVLSGQAPEDVLKSELSFIDKIGLRQHLAMTRANGLAAMIKQIKLYALGFQSQHI